jgi:CRP-like cAMP-binding protein
LSRGDHVLIKRLQTVAPLAADEIQALIGLFRPGGQVPRHTDIVQDGSSPDHCTLILSGFACRYKLLPNGNRQIHAFKFTGDMPDLYSFVLGYTDHAIGALISCDVALIPQRELQRVTESFPNITRALWRESLTDAAMTREWATGLGRRDAHARIAHLICEQYYRMKAAGLARDDILEFPVTQTDIADAAGLSTVHANRTMKALSRERLISYRNHSIAILDWQGLQTAGQFDPAYLYWPDGSSRSVGWASNRR